MALISLIPHSFNNSIIEQRITDGYINATAMCQATNKLIADYLRLDTTKSFLSALSIHLSIPAILHNPDMRTSVSALVLVFKGGNSQQGTWVHPQVAINLARWCSPEFAVQATQWVFDWLTTGQNPIKATTPLPAQQPPQPPSLPECKQKRLDAKNAILQSFSQFRQSNNSTYTSRAAQYFCFTFYPNGLPEWVTELYPELSWQTLTRWHDLAQKRGQTALIDKYGTRKGKTVLQKHPELGQLFTKILTENPQIPGTELHKALAKLTSETPSLSSIQRLKRQWLNSQTAIQHRQS
jgi:hypothetical protein